ncbi:5-hydroxyisourate hydrolase-like isoform X3 [Amphiura filiformis]|uniref:5-hydroxyisourate hydrolase-like isoform X2 n=1 Tax=Amphiura filiformis TaxID=82378 RepID=UPI003B228D0D
MFKTVIALLLLGVVVAEKERKHNPNPISTNPTMSSYSPLTTHVLDTSKGEPARALKIELYKSTGENEWTSIANGETNNDGRLPALLTQADFTRGIYKIKFDTGDYFRKNSVEGFYPYAEVVFEIQDPNQHYHVPLLLSPYSYSTYRGS